MKDAPLSIPKVKRIVELRDVHGWTFDQISDLLTLDGEPITRMGVWSLYKRWRNWYYNEIGRGIDKVQSGEMLE